MTLLLGCVSLRAEVIRLKGGTEIKGDLLAERPDKLVVDLGFSVLTIPTEHVLEVVRGAEPQAEADASAEVQAGNNLYFTRQEAPQERSVRELVASLGEAVVQVRTPAGLGSGFILNEDGYLITNFHVIEGESEIGVEVYHRLDGQLDRRTYKEVRIIAMNKFADLALLKIEDAGAPKFSHVPLGDVETLEVGERVFAIGSPLGLERTVTEGIVSTKTRGIEGSLYLQTTAQINPGNSGGPLFNLRGEVIGVTNMKIQFGEGIGFAIPVDSVKYFLQYRDAYAYDKENPSNPYRYLSPPRRDIDAVSAEETKSEPASQP